MTRSPLRSTVAATAIVVASCLFSPKRAEAQTTPGNKATDSATTAGYAAPAPQAPAAPASLVKTGTNSRQQGFKAGITSSNMTVNTAGTSVTFSRSTGLAAGAFSVRPINATLSSQAEAMVTMKGTHIGETSLRLVYLDVSGLLRANIAGNEHNTFFAFAGPTVGLKLSASASDGSSSGNVDDARAFDLGLTFGVGADLGQSFVIDARYTLGLTTVVSGSADGTLKNRAFSLLAGIRF
jgi:hypothetical protein